LRFGYLRAAVYAAVVLGTAVALTFIPRLPDSRPADILFSQAAVPAGKMQYDTLDAGETLSRVLKRGGLSDSAMIAAIRASSKSIDARRILPGTPITISSEAADSAPSKITLQLSIDRVVELTRVGDTWTGKEVNLPWVPDTIAVAGTIQSNLYKAVDEVASNLLPYGARQQLTNAIAENVYNYKIDMNRELQKGDEFKAIAVVARGPNGAVKVNNIVAASFSLSGTVLKAFNFESSTGGDYFDEQGKSLKAMFSKNPVRFSRISSNFGSRRHPILGYVRAHKGTDYAAAEGTDVHSIGDGVVLRSGMTEGYGNLIEIRHINGYVTRYGHLSSRLVYAGQRVKIDQKIGEVGHTGLATGPHLHFEVLVNGEQRNALTLFRGLSGSPVSTAETDTFARLRDALLLKLNAVSRNSATALHPTATQAGTPR
jgi:murein DD-endopeptidase MepM/ murein hydrolase activator NlpD